MYETAPSASTRRLPLPPPGMSAPSRGRCPPMTTDPMARLELAAHRHAEAAQALAAARDDLVVEIAAALRAVREDVQLTVQTETDIARLTGWEVAELRRLVQEADLVGMGPV
ncbi:hypothetical protein SSBG_00037 [Streptomyces sp. SPB074]|nr:hypothetical protein SSBG_00037 [Streptomyces sp. SPB074]